MNANMLFLAYSKQTKKQESPTLQSYITHSHHAFPIIKVNNF